MDESSDPVGSARDGALLDAVALGAKARREGSARRFRLSLAYSATVTLIWFVSVTVAGLWGRVADNWVSSLTMVFGSFVAGSTPQGGGAVAFPVFTKVLDVPAEVARTFSLCIQSVGMSTASVSIIINRRVVEWRAAITGAVVGSTAFVVALLTLGDRNAPYWPIDLPGPYVKVTFTLVLCAMAWVMFLGRRMPIRPVSDDLPPLNGRLRAALVIAGVLGGVAAALVGSGTDVMIYLFVVVLFGVRAGVGVPTSVITMATVSIVGFVVLGLIDGQFFVDFDDAGMVTAAGGEALAQPLKARQADLFGMWIAAAPIVAWGAPVGSVVAARMSARALLNFVIALALAETLSTVVFLTELRTDPALALFGAVGLVIALGGLTWVATHRQRLFGLPDLDASTLLTRSNVEVSDSYREEFR